MTQKLICHINKPSDTYEIEIGSAIWDNQIQYLKTLASRFAIITDDTIAELYGEKLKKYLSASDLVVFLFTFPPGEKSKSRENKEVLENQLFEKGLGRDTCFIALGGGVVTDLAGYVAATYCRGVPLVMMSTSLLGMVDACIGGKTGVNVPYGKNLLGCIYQPKKVVIDISTLKTLPKKEFVGGVVEMIKHGVIADANLFNYLESNSSQILNLEEEVLEIAIFESCRIKKEIVEQDERENGKRHLLNFGHTLGHALESLTHYSLSHGEAVAIGILVESYLCLLLGILDQESFNRIKNILMDYHLPLKLPYKFSIKTLLEAMTLDKKSREGKPRFVTINGIGSPVVYNSHYCRHVEESILIKALKWMNLEF